LKGKAVTPILDWMAENGHLDATYIGDGAYASHDGRYLWLCTQRDNGIHAVALEPTVFHDMLRFVRKIEKLHGAPGYWTGETKKGETK
jgi:hypothetical protein